MKPKSRFYSKYYTYIKPITKLPIIKTYGSMVFTLGIITFFIFYAIKPTVETILILQKKLEDTTIILDQINLKAKNLSQGKSNLENMNPNTKSKIENLIPNTVSLKSVIQTLEKTTQLHQASISALQIQPITVEPKSDDSVGTVENIGFIFNTQGEYKNLVSILQDLKRSDRLLTIDSVSFSNQEESGLIMSISGKVYYLK